MKRQWALGKKRPRELIGDVIVVADEEILDVVVVAVAVDVVDIAVADPVVVSENESEDRSR